MYSDFFKLLTIIIAACAISACMPPPVKKPQAEQEAPVSEPEQVADEPAQSTVRSVSKSFRQTWVNPDISPDGIGKVLVIAVLDDETQGSQYEIELTAALMAQGIDAVPRANILSLAGTPGKGRVDWVVKNDQYDHLLVTRLCPLEDSELSQAGGTAFEIAGERGQFGAIWKESAKQPVNPRESGRYAWLFVETSMFDGSEGKVVWRNRNQTSDPLFTESPAELIEELTNGLQADGLIQ